jgi:hypothetical protein
LGQRHLRTCVEQSPDAWSFLARHRGEHLRAGRDGVRLLHRGEHPVHRRDALLLRKLGQTAPGERANVLAESSCGLGLLHRLRRRLSPFRRLTRSAVSRRS